MKVTPILMSTPMAESILVDTKTETRRIDKTLQPFNLNPNCWIYDGLDEDDEAIHYLEEVNSEKEHLEKYIAIKSRYGKTGDLLYVKETFCKFEGEIIYKANSPFTSGRVGDGTKNPFPSIKAGYGIQWQSSLHMPKAAARIWLMIESVHPERLHSISEKESLAEGVLKITPEEAKKHNIPQLHPTASFNWHRRYTNLHKGPWICSARASFITLWEYINGDSSWDTNPWVWVIKYRVTSKTGRPSDQEIQKHQNLISKCQTK